MHTASYLSYPRRVVTKSPSLEDKTVLASRLRNRAGHQGLSNADCAINLLFGLPFQTWHLKVCTFSLLGQAQVDMKSLTILNIVLPSRSYLAFAC